MADNTPALYDHYIPERDYIKRDYKPFGKPFDDMCGHCEQYYAMLYKKGMTDRPFPPNCKKHIAEPLQHIKPEDFDTDEEYMKAVVALDPISWAVMQFGWEARWYQEEMLSCTAKYKVMRCGRRVGKCLKFDTPVLTPSGPVEIQHLKAGDTVYDEHGEEVRVLETFDQGMQEVVDLSNNGRVVATCTKNHPWLTKHNRLEGTKVRKVEEFYKGVKICRTEVTAPLGTCHQGGAYALGALLGDGNSRTAGLVISSDDEPIVSKICGIVNVPYKKNKANNYDWYFPEHTKDRIAHYKEWIDGRYAHEKTVDLEIIKSWNRESLLEFVAGLIDTDGSVVFSGSEITISLDMQAKAVVEAFQYALLALWQVQSTLGIEYREKYKNGPIYYARVKHIHHCKRILRELSHYLQCERKQYREEYDALEPNNFEPTSIGVTISNPRMEHCYDIHVDSPTNLYLLANGLATHNTEGACVALLHYAITHSNRALLVLAPYESQVSNIFQMLSKLIESSNNLAQSVSRKTLNPHRIQFANGSYILGFSAGSKTAARSDKVRGQDAHVIYIDEFDYIPDSDVAAVTAILISHPDCQLWTTSTPTGEHKRFFAICTDKNLGYKEFWFTSTEIPHWNEEMEKEMRREYSAVTEDSPEWQHEVLAEFGDQVQGVFRNSMIDKSLQDYTLGTISPVRHGTYILGVDWNKTAGTHMVIVEWNGVFTLIDKIVIPRGDFTQLAAVEKIIELHERWDFKGIYVDRGYGSTQVEMLKRHGMKHPHLNMQLRLKDFAMQEMVVVRDPTNGAEIKKHTKPFLVNALSMMLDGGMLVLPKSEDTRVVRDDMAMGVVQQMRNFKIEGYSVHGLPKYSQGQEHTLTSLMLAVGGFQLLHSDLTKVSLSGGVAVTPAFGQTEENFQNQSFNSDILKEVQDDAAARDLDRGAPHFGFEKADSSSILQQQRLRNLSRRRNDRSVGDYSRGNIGRSSRKNV